MDVLKDRDRSGSIFQRLHGKFSLEMVLSRGDYPQMTLFQVSEILYFTQIQWFCLKLCCFPNQRPNISPLKCAAHVAGEIEGLIGWLSGVVSRLLDPRGRYQ